MKKLSFIYLPILFLIYILIETLLKLNNASICESSGCKLADNLIWFDAIYLNYMGMLTAIALMLFGWLSYNKKIHQGFFYVTLLSALFFETVLLGYQYFVSPQMCKFCMGIYGFLFLMTILSLRGKYLLVIFPAIVSVLIALSFLALPKAKVFMVEDGKYLLQSSSCPHCTEVKEYLNEENIEFTKIDIESIEAQNFSTFMNFHTIPTLLIKKGSHIEIINGDKDIINFFFDKIIEQKNMAPIELEESVSINVSNGSSSLFDAVEKDRGCGFASLEKVESDCSK